MAHEVVLVCFEDMLALDLSGPLEVFAAASVAGEVGGGFYRVRTASPGGRGVRASNGLRVGVDVALEEVEGAHTLLVVGGPGARRRDGLLAGRVGRVAARSERVVSVCTGAFVLAAAGLLEGRRVTTHWRHWQELAALCPGAVVESDPVFVRDGRVWTSAGVSAGIDVALALVEQDRGRAVALEVARSLVVFLERPGGQAQFSAALSGQWAQRPGVRAVQHWVVEHPGADLSVGALAERAGLSVRQFSRVFAAQVGCTPGRYVERVRVEAARRWLEECDAPVSAVARRCGFGGEEVMRRVFVRVVGCAPSQYRQRFRGV